MKPDFTKMELIPAIVQEEKTKQVLMLAYVNEESYEKMLATRQTWFYSRSRKALWHKGETSGNIQKIKKMKLDCDKDALLITVEQKGVACHTGAYSCFFNSIIEAKDEVNARILEELYRQIEDRKSNPKEGSYTNYLLEEGVDKIGKKIGEEATEVVIASKNSSRSDLIGEISDLLYHVEVLMVNQEILLEEVKAEMTKRHRVEGNKKKFKKRGAY